MSRFEWLLAGEHSSGQIFFANKYFCCSVRSLIGLLFRCASFFLCKEFIIMRKTWLKVSGVVFVVFMAVASSYASAPPAGPIPWPKGTKLAAVPPAGPIPWPKGTKLAAVPPAGPIPWPKGTKFAAAPPAGPIPWPKGTKFAAAPPAGPIPWPKGTKFAAAPPAGPIPWPKGTKLQTA